MLTFKSFAYNLWQISQTLGTLFIDVCRFLILCRRRAAALAAENLFLRKQLAQYQEHQVTPQRAIDAIRLVLVWLSRFFDWPSALVIVQPTTLIRWLRQGFRLWWRWKSKPGRSLLPKELRELIRHMARENSIWGQQRFKPWNRRDSPDDWEKELNRRIARMWQLVHRAVWPGWAVESR